MYQVLRDVGEPDLGIPGDVLGELLELRQVGECRNVYFSCCAFEHRFKLDDPLFLRRDRGM